MGLFSMGCFPGDSRKGKRPIKAFGGNGPLRVGNGPLPLDRMDYISSCLKILLCNLCNCFTCPLHILFTETFLCKAELSRDFECVVLCAPKSAANSRVVVLCAHKNAANSSALCT